jgi:hypothetical protein
VVIPVADLPNTGKGLEYHLSHQQEPTEQDTEDFASSFPATHADREEEEHEEQDEVESPVGIVGKQSFQLNGAEQKVSRVTRGGSL